MRLEGEKVIAHVQFVPQLLDDRFCFQIAYVVPKAYRRRGLALSTVRAALAEIKHQFSLTPLKSILIEAVVASDNIASRRVAEQLLGEGVAIEEGLSNLPAFHYVLEIDLTDSRASKRLTRKRRH